MQMEFGKAFKEKYFNLDPEAVFCNHGSFGAVPKSVQQYRIELLEEVNRHPDSWFRRNSVRNLTAVAAKISQFVGCDEEDAVLVDNATTGISILLHSLKLAPSDRILITSHTYAAVKKAANECGAIVHELDIEAKVSSKESVVGMYRQALSVHNDVKLAIVDHVTSPSAMLLPLAEIVEACRENDVMILVDGAHSPGHIPLDLKALDPDFFVGNLHKWLFCTRGCAVMYVKKVHQDRITPVVVSHNHYEPFQKRFPDGSTRDYTQLCCASKGLEFFEQCGGFECITPYNVKLLKWATDHLIKQWKTQGSPFPEELQAPFMSLVMLPPKKEYLPPSEASANRMMSDLFSQFNVQSVVQYIFGNLWCRLSVQNYNCKEDFERLAEAVLAL